MGLWFSALKARKAGNRPRTFYTGLTVALLFKKFWIKKKTGFAEIFKPFGVIDFNIASIRLCYFYTAINYVTYRSMNLVAVKSLPL